MVHRLPPADGKRNQSMLNALCSMLEISTYHARIVKNESLARILSAYNNNNKTPVYEDTHPCTIEIYDFRGFIIDCMGSGGLFYRKHHICAVFLH
jgi:hypothetical protein